MPRFQTDWPRCWLLTDPRLGDRLWSAIDALPRGSGVIVRYGELDRRAREDLAGAIAAKARERGLVLGIAGDVELAMEVGADLVHNPGAATHLRFSRSVHVEVEAEAANQANAALAFVSPIFPTRSHPGAKVLGIEHAEALARMLHCPAIALGGMNQARFTHLSDFHGWAGIDAWAGDQNLKAVPT